MTPEEFMKMMQEAERTMGLPQQSDEDAIEELTTLLWNTHVALIKKGFTVEQAFELTLQMMKAKCGGR